MTSRTYSHGGGHDRRHRTSPDRQAQARHHPRPLAPLHLRGPDVPGRHDRPPGPRQVRRAHGLGQPQHRRGRPRAARPSRGPARHRRSGGVIKALTARSGWKRDEAAAAGSDIHGMAERIARGEPLPGGVADRSAPGSRRMRPGGRRAAGVSASPRPSSSSPTLGYGGTLDLLAYDETGRTVLADVKIGQERLPRGAAAAAGLRRGRRSSPPQGSPVVYPMPAIDRYAVLHVTDGGVRVIDVEVDDDDAGAFRACLPLSRWHTAPEGPAAVRDAAVGSIPVRSRRGRSNRRRGNDWERSLASELGGRRVGQYGEPADVLTPLLAVQAKVGASFSERYWRWLYGHPPHRRSHPGAHRGRCARAGPSATRLRRHRARRLSRPPRGGRAVKRPRRLRLIATAAGRPARPRATDRHEPRRPGPRGRTPGRRTTAGSRYSPRPLGHRRTAA